MNFKYKDYIPYFKNFKANYTDNITLIVSKDTRISSITFNFTIYFSQINITDLNSNSNNNIDSNAIDYSNLILIIPDSRGMKNEDLILTIKFLDITLNTNLFSYYWSVNDLNIDSLYLNGRIENTLRIKNNILPIGKSMINLQLTDIHTGITYNKKYYYIKDQPPYGGSCIVNTIVGKSLETQFSFEADGWVSTNTPLLYRFYYFTSNNAQISLSPNDLFTTFYLSKLLPTGDSYYLDVMDSNGLVSTSKCPVNVLKNTDNNFSLDKLLLTIDDPVLKILAVQAYQSNNFTSTTYAALSLDFASDLINKKSDKIISLQEISNNINVITSQMKNIEHIDNSTFNKVNNLLDYTLNNIDTIASQPENVGNVIDVINNNLDFIKSQNNSIELIRKFDKHLETIHESLYKNFIPGQSVIFNNRNFVSQISKITATNMKTMSITTDDENNKKVRLMSAASYSNCTHNSVLCLDNKMIEAISKISGPTIGISTKISKNDILPILYPSFSNNSLRFSVLDSSGKRRLLSSEFASQYEVNLKVPVTHSEEIIKSTTCAKFDENNQLDSYGCESWYNYETSKVVCICNGPGLTVNIMDDTIASLYKFKQFPVPKENLRKLFYLN